MLAVTLATCAASPVEEPPPPTPPPPPAVPTPPPAQKPYPDVAEAQKVLEEAAKAQGTAAHTGKDAVTRFLVRFQEIHFLDPDKGDHQLESAEQAFAAAAEPGGKDRLRSEGTAAGERTVLGHSGRVGWVLAGGQVRTLTDKVRDEADLNALADRRRMLRIAQKSFFLGNLRGDPVPLRLLPDEPEATFPRRAGKPLVVPCRVLERAADPESGDPAVRIYIHRDTRLPVAASFLPEKEGVHGWLIVLQYDPKLKREAGAVPEGMVIPDWLELFQVPPAKEEKPVLRVQASVDGLVIGAEKVPDSLFAVPAK